MNPPSPGSRQELDSLYQQVATALRAHPQWQLLGDALNKRAPYIAWLHNDNNHRRISFRCQPGNPAVLLDDSRPHANFESFLENVITPSTTAGWMHDNSKSHTYDDRKLRWSNIPTDLIINHEASSLSLCVAPTCYQHCQLDIHRSPQDALNLMLSGIRKEADPYLYFARGMGVCIIPVTRDGTVFIGQRKNSKEYCHYLSFISGWASFHRDVKHIDFYHDAEQEIKEEILYSGSIEPGMLQFVGISGHPLTGETDIVFCLHCKLSDEHFLTKDWPEHLSWFPLRSRKEAISLRDHGQIANAESPFRIMFSSRMGLDYLISNNQLL